MGVLSQKLSLRNGVRVVMEEMEHFESISIGIWIRMGSKYECLEENGYTHLLEHMLFKGTKRRSYEEIGLEVDRVGGYLNAYTSKDLTCVHIQLLKEHLDIGVDLLGDMVYESELLEEELEKEKEVVKEEIKMNEDNPEGLLYDLFCREYYGGKNLGLSILGSEDAIEGCDREDLRGFYEKHYRNENIVVSLCGNLGGGGLEGREEYWEEYMEGKLGRECMGGYKREEEAECEGGKVGEWWKEKDLEQVYILMGVGVMSFWDKRKWAFYILNRILGGASSSRLYREIREKRGLVYSISSWYSLHEKSGVWFISSSTRVENYEEVIELTKKELESVVGMGIEEEELEWGKEQVKGSMIFGLEGVESRMMRNGKWELLYGKEYNQREDLMELEEVKMEDMEGVIEDVLCGVEASIYCLGRR